MKRPEPIGPEIFSRKLRESLLCTIRGTCLVAAVVCWFAAMCQINIAYLLGTGIGGALFIILAPSNGKSGDIPPL